MEKYTETFDEFINEGYGHRIKYKGNGGMSDEHSDTHMVNYWDWKNFSILDSEGKITDKSIEISLRFQSYGDENKMSRDADLGCSIDKNGKIEMEIHNKKITSKNWVKGNSVIEYCVEEFKKWVKEEKLI